MLLAHYLYYYHKIKDNPVKLLPTFIKVRRDSIDRIFLIDSIAIEDRRGAKHVTYGLVKLRSISTVFLLEAGG
jgi:hypothetical protein